MANFTKGAISVAITATQIVAGDSTRKGLIISNTSTSATLFVGPTSAITTANAIPVFPQGTFIMSGTDEQWAGDVWGISTTTIDVRFFEWGQ